MTKFPMKHRPKLPKSARAKKIDKAYKDMRMVLVETPDGQQGRMPRALLEKHNNTARSLAASKNPETAARAKLEWPVLVEVMEVKAGAPVQVKPTDTEEFVEVATQVMERHALQVLNDDIPDEPA